MEWINCRERNPNHTNNVLVTDKINVWIGDYSYRRTGSGWAVVYDGTIHVESENITHWMELPDAIKGYADTTN